jgi:hypothetical protein
MKREETVRERERERERGGGREKGRKEDARGREFRDGQRLSRNT